jgi:transcriptional regulator with PAS, ATPase and Fis domain
VQKGEYRQDLLYRLDILKLYIPPLRKRKEDIYDLFMHYIDTFNNKFNTDIQKLTTNALEMLIEYDFKGNVRELMNIAERICALNTSKIIGKDVMQAALFPKDIDDETGSIENESIKNYYFQNEKELIEKALIDANLNKTHAAKMLGINRSTLWRKLKKYNIHIEGRN